MATAIGGVGVLVYNEMKASRNQLSETTEVTKQLNESSITGIDRMNAIDRALKSIDARLDKLEEESAIFTTVNRSNSHAITLISEALEKVKLSDNQEVTERIREAESVTNKSSMALERLPELAADREKIRTEQQQQQMQLESYRNIQQQQQQQQQAW